MEILIISLPLLSFLFTSIFNNNLNTKVVKYIPTSIMAVCCLYSFYLFYKIFYLNEVLNFYISSWISSGVFVSKWSFSFDILTSVMMIVVTTISLIVHIYSIKDIKNHKLKVKFIGYISFSTFSMLLFISSNNLLQLFLGWQLIGFSSFLLIGNLDNKIVINKAALKLFIINRLSDISFILSIVMLYSIFETISFETIFETVPVLRNYNFHILSFYINGVELAASTLLFSAIIRSAQLFFYIWSSDSFDIPIPVLTLLYSSTLIPAGIFVLFRFSPFLEYAPFALNLLSITGLITLIFLSVMALTEFNMKRILIYAACSQISLVIFAVGISAYNAAIFHFFNFAFFNALLFLSLGSIIRSLDYKSDIRKMGGLYSKFPVTFILTYIGCFSIVGIPFFSGFYSKEVIISILFLAKSFISSFALILIFFSSLLTSFIFWRLIFLTFHGEFKGEINQHNKIKEYSPVLMSFMFLLAVMSIFSGWLLYDFFVGNNWEIFWKDSLFILPNSGGAMDLNLVPSWIQLFLILLSIIGIGIAILFYLIIPSLPILLIDKLKPLYLLSYNKWFLRKSFYFFLVKPLNLLFNLLVLLIQKQIYLVNFIIIKNFIMIKVLNQLPKIEKFIKKYFFILFLLSILSLFYIDMVFINDF